MRPGSVRSHQVKVSTVFNANDECNLASVGRDRRRRNHATITPLPQLRFRTVTILVFPQSVRRSLGAQIEYAAAPEPGRGGAHRLQFELTHAGFIDDMVC